MTAPTYFRSGRHSFALPIKVGDTVLKNSNLEPTKTTIKAITTIASGERVPGRRGGPYRFQNGYAYILHLSTGTKVLYSGHNITL